MPSLTIDDLSVEVEQGATLLNAAEKLFIDIPTLCHLKAVKPTTSCMICVVKDSTSGKLLPACSTLATEGMKIETRCAEIKQARLNILNLLLSEHIGDCKAPCHRICPADLNIPRMLREIERGHVELAQWIAKRDLAIPHILGHICPAPCEKGCRRKLIDHSIAIRDTHKQLKTNNIDAQWLPTLDPHAQKIVIIGSGPAGLAAAWQLRLLGYNCTLYDESTEAGGSLREIDSERLPAEVIAAEINSFQSVGIHFALGESPSIHQMASNFEGLIFAEAHFSGAHFKDAFFAEEHKLTVKAVANGKAAAHLLDQSLKKKRTTLPAPFECKITTFRKKDAMELSKNCQMQQRAITTELAQNASRCLHCDCRKPISCKLRRYAEQYGANQKTIPADERVPLQVIGHDQAIIYEPGKCIKCGRCVQLTKQAGETLGMTFIGRGFNTSVAVPFDEKIDIGLKKTATECVDACPTGALAFRTLEETLA